jgi:hypothetical protein
MAAKNYRRSRRSGAGKLVRTRRAAKSAATRGVGRAGAASKRKRATPTVAVAARRVVASARRLAKDLVKVGAHRARLGRKVAARRVRSAARGVQLAARGAGSVGASALVAVADRLES